MAVIHRTFLKPGKLELLTSWLPTRPWYRGGAAGPELAKAGGFRLDDPDGAVGIEFMVVTDVSGAEPVTYLVPLTYRDAPLDGAEHALVGTAEHGVLGRRWVYDGCHDPVLVTELLALVEGTAQAQDQNVSDTPAPDVSRSRSGEAPLAPDLGRVPADDRDGTDLPLSQGTTLRVRRLLRPAPDGAPVLPPGAIGHVAAPWNLPDGTRTKGLIAVLHSGRGTEE
ncbi:1,4-alpha-glucan branching protein [Streptomyces sp. NPDC028635]|uniref:maltokinase N-terminal cap-like domain-containing protein n=1 Tax=Streptomyces sp. NPDC028635 TaxID=3154800 RepID=UPI0033C3729B